MPNVPMNPNGFPMGGGQPQQPDPTGPFAQRLETSLNPKIGVPGKDSDPQVQAAFMLKDDPQGAVKLAQTIMQAVQAKMMQARQMMMARQGGMPPPQQMGQVPMQQPQGVQPMAQHPMTPQAMQQGGQ